MGDPTIPWSTRSPFQGASQAIVARDPLLPMDFYMVLTYGPCSYVDAKGNLYWETSRDEEYNSFIAITLKIWFYFHPIKSFLDASGYTRQRRHQMEL